MNHSPRSRRRVTCVIGSVARASINRRLAGALVRLAPPDLDLHEAPIAALPLYDYGLDDAFPPPARAFKQAILEADGVLLITPEYNRSIPGALKNAIDWASRPHGDNAFAGKPTAIIGASPGKVGTAAAQQHLKAVMNYCDARLMNQPEAYIQLAADAIADDGQVTDAGLAEVLRAFLTAFGNAIRVSSGARDTAAAAAASS